MEGISTFRSDKKFSLHSYMIIYIYVSSFDLSGVDELSKTETATVYRLIVYIYTYVQIDRQIDRQIDKQIDIDIDINL